MLEPGTVVAPGRLIPEGQVWGGNPAMFVRTLTEGEIDGLESKAVDTWHTADQHRQQFLPHSFAYVRLLPSPLFPSFTCRASSTSSTRSTYSIHHLPCVLFPPYFTI
jgi:hypothetical protein